MAKQRDPQEILTKEVRFSYLNIWEPRAMNEGDDAKYSVSVLVDKEDKVTLKRIEGAIKACEADLAAKCGGKLPRKYRTPLRDGDEEKEDDEAYEGKMFLTASSKRQPGIVDEDRDEFMDEEKFYSGCYGRVVLRFYAYNNQSKGIACGLQNIQKLRDGERLGGGGRTAAADDFDDE